MLDQHNEMNVTPPLTLASLPLDIHVTLMDYLAPVDLIALRQTCSTLYDASQRRIVWMKAFMSICIENNVFLPSFPIEEMSTTALLKASAGPLRWINALEKAQSKILSPLQASNTWARNSELIIDPPSLNKIPFKLQLSATEEIQGIMLIPGGRFLLILTLQGVQLWDLDWTDEGPEKKGRKLMASLELCQQYNIGFAVQSTKDGTGIYVMIVSFPINSDLSERKHLVIYKVDFGLVTSGAEPEFVKVASIEANAVSKWFSSRLADNRLIFSEGRKITVWDFIENKSVTLQSEDFETFFVLSDSVILMSFNGAKIWKIPELIPVDQSATLSTTPENKKSLATVLEVDGLGRPGWIGETLDWYWNRRNFKFFDMFSASSENVTMRRHQLPSASTEFKDPTGTETSYTGLPLVFQNTFNTDTESWKLIYRPCEDRMVAYSGPTAKNPNYHIFVMGNEPEKNIRASVSLKHDVYSVMDCSLCPVSGRMCYATDENEIEVLDLFRGLA